MRRTARFTPVVRSVCVSGVVALLVSGCAHVNATLGDVLATVGPLDAQTIVAGLKEALKIGTERTVETTSKLDGYYRNPRIRIPLPRELDPVADTLRSIGLGGRVDEFERVLNHAAEKAAGEVVDVFWSAIQAMTLDDAKAILDGHDRAATEFFQTRTEAELRRRFQPVVVDKLHELGYLRTYDKLVAAYTAIPLREKPSLDLEGYVTARALDGLFTILGDEEQRIRDDPAARTTALLRRVFGAS